MATDTSQISDYQTILKVVHSWTPTVRVMLMQDVLRSLQPELGGSRPRRATLGTALGMLANDQPAPSDADVARWLDEHRIRKYG